MLLKNNSQKVIHVGNVMILPDETKPVDDSLSTAPAVVALIERNALAVVKAPVKPKEPAEEPGNDGEAPGGEGKKPLSRMNKQELADECIKLGIEVTEEDTKDTLVEKLKVAAAG